MRRVRDLMVMMRDLGIRPSRADARVEKEIKTLRDQREMEVKIETRMKEDARIRRENREHKRKVPAV